MKNNPYLLSPIEAGQVLGIGRDRMRMIIKRNPDAPVIKIGDRIKVIIPKFEEWLAQCAEEGRTL